MKDPFKLLHPTVEQVLDLHHDTIEAHGGKHGLRDHGLLMAALAMPRQTYAGELLHPSAAEMAAAYLFHLAMNHPFIDGNKRIGVLTALYFLDANNYELAATEDEIEAITLNTAASQLSKTDLTKWFKANIQKID